jgi:hypothetical protein
MIPERIRTQFTRRFTWLFLLMVALSLIGLLLLMRNL